MNYTVAVPIVKNGQTKGSIFGSIYFDDIAEIIMRSTCDKSRSFYLLGGDHQIMADKKHEPYGKTLEEHALYIAKQGGKNQYAIYDSETDDTDSH